VKCLRCGHCCIAYDVIIVSPEYVNKIKDLLDHSSLKEEWFIHKESGVECPHLYVAILEKDRKLYACRIHYLPWFKDTPCAEYGQIELEDSNCRTGDYKLNGITFGQRRI